MRKGQKHTEEAKMKNRQAHLGKKTSEETKSKMSVVQKGTKLGQKNPFWRGGRPKCLDCGVDIDYNAKRCVKHYGLKGDKNPAWKGGITPKNAKIRKSLEY